MSKADTLLLLSSLEEIKKTLKRHGKKLKELKMQKSELEQVEQLNSQLAKVNGEYSAFISETNAKNAENAATVATLNEHIAALETQVADMADPTEAQAALDQAKTLIQQLDDNRVDVPEVLPPVETGETGTTAETNGNVADPALTE